MVSLHGLGLISQSFDLFPKLPVELQINIWEAALRDREDRVVFPVLECVSAPHLPLMSNVNYECNRAESCCTNPIIRTPVPALLHACQQSRTIAQRTYIDIGQGGLFDARDKLLVTASPLYTRLWCSRHKEEVYGTAPSVNHTTMLEWSHVQHVIYYAPALPRLGSQQWRGYGEDLQCMFRTRAGGCFVETITVLTDETKEEFRTSLNQGWTEPIGNKKFEKEPREPVLNWMDDPTTLQQAKQMLGLIPKFRIPRAGF